MFLEEHRNRSRVIHCGAILYLIYNSHYFSGPFPKIFLNIFFWITYSAILFIPKSWWNRTKLFLIVLALLIETAAGVYWFHETNLIYFLAIITFTATVQLSMSKSAIPAVTALFVTATFYIRFGSGSFFSMISFLFLAVVLYFTIRMRMQRNEMHELNQLHLAELKEAYEQLQEASVTSMQYAVLEERTRIAREIHDSVGHSLTSLIVQLQALKYMIKKDPDKADDSLDMMLAVARKGLNDIRTSVHSLADNQVISGSLPLKALLSRMETTASIQYEFHSEFHDEDLNASTDGLLFRILQEGITNIIRHSQATFVSVSLTKAAGKMVMRIRDNGLLNPNDRIKEGFGLKAMRARLEDRGGRLKLAAIEPHGFEIAAEIPIDEHLVNEG